MFKLKFKTTMIAAAIVSLVLLSFVGYSDAIEIEELTPYYTETTFDGNRNWNYVYIKTNTPYIWIEYYVTQNDNREWADESWGDTVTTEAYFAPWWLRGSVTGETYEIEVVANALDENFNILSDSKSYTLTVFEPIIEEGYKKLGVWGRAKLSRQYYSHPYVDIDCYVSAYNPGVCFDGEEVT